MSPPAAPGLRKGPDYGALYQPSEQDLISPKRIYQTAGFVSIQKCLKHSKKMLEAIETGQCLFRYLEKGPAEISRVHLPSTMGVPLMDDEFEDAANDPHKILHPAPLNISSSHRRKLLNGDVPDAPRKSQAEFLSEMRVVGWVLMSLRHIKLAWLLRTAPLPLHYVRLIRRSDFNWLEPKLPEERRLPSDLGLTNSEHRRFGGRSSKQGFIRENSRRRSSTIHQEPHKLSRFPPLLTKESRKESVRIGSGLPPKWADLAMCVEGGEKVIGIPEDATPPWQSVVRQERKQRHLFNLERRSNATDAVRLLEQLKSNCADTRRRMFHIYDHRVQRMDADHRQRLTHKYLSVQTATCTELALKATRNEVRQRVEADRPAIVPARWYKLLHKRAQELGCDQEAMDEFEERLGPFITDELSTFTSAAERLCFLVMSLPVYELMMPCWQKALLFVLVEVLQHYEGLLHGWLQWRHYPDYILNPNEARATPAAE